MCALRAKDPNAAKVLILSGGNRNHHAYRRQTHLLQGELEQTGRGEATICELGEILETTAMSKFDTVILMADRHHAEFALAQSQQRALVAWVANGKGLVTFHAFCIEPGETKPTTEKTTDRRTPGKEFHSHWIPEMNEMIGGTYHYDGSSFYAGPFKTKITDREHVITRNIKDLEFFDELYEELYMPNDKKSRVLAVGGDPKTGKDWPVMWTRPWGKGRVFHTPLGHCGHGATAFDPLTVPDFINVIVNAVCWTAGKLDAAQPAPVPATAASR